MNNIVKIIISILLIIISFVALGIWPYTGVIISIFLFASSIMGVITLWKKRKNEGEGELFKSETDQLDKK